MKANRQHLGFETTQTSFMAYWVKSPLFGFHWHYHPEYEICYVKRGHGTRLVGDNVSLFEEGDLVLVGSNLPHTWISDDDFNNKSEDMEVIVVQFTNDLLPTSFLKLPELYPIQKLIQASKRGVFFENVSNIEEELTKLIELDGFARFNQLLSVLHQLGNAPQKTLLASRYHTPLLSKENENRISEVFSFIHGHYTEHISLTQAASLANMNETAFCRFFKKNTGVSLTTYISNLRIGHACNLLIDSDKTISEIAYDCGFNNITHFNRTFLKIKNSTPSNYRRKFR